MRAELSFSAPRFADADERPDAVSSNQERALLVWLAGRLTALGLVSDAEVEPSGPEWFLDVCVFSEPYRLECSEAHGISEQNWRLSLSAQRSIVDRLLGRRELTADDALLRIVREILERQADFSGIELVMK